MKIGLLECDHVLPELRSIGGDYRDMFPALLPDLEFVNFDVVNGKFPASTDDCQAYLCTGSKYSVYENRQWIPELKSFVRDLYEEDRHFIGICFGHQLLAEALGGKVEKGNAGWCVGVHEFDIIERKPWMQPYKSKVSLLMSCQDQVVDLPGGSVVLARAADCQIGMFMAGNRMLAMQAHPEFPKAYAAALLQRRVDLIGAVKAGKSLDSLALPIQAKVVASWIRHFLGT